MNEHDGLRLMEYLDGTLSPAERERVEAWLAVDAAARRLVAEHRAVWALLGDADVAPAAEASAEFRRSTLRRVHEEPERDGIGGWRPRLYALAAASVLVGVALFAWHDAATRATLAAEDLAVVGNLDLLENLDFLTESGPALDVASGAAVLRVFPPVPRDPDGSADGARR